MRKGDHREAKNAQSVPSFSIAIKSTPPSTSKPTLADSILSNQRILALLSAIIRPGAGSHGALDLLQVAGQPGLDGVVEEVWLAHGTTDGEARRVAYSAGWKGKAWRDFEIVSKDVRKH